MINLQLDDLTFPTRPDEYSLRGLVFRGPTRIPVFAQPDLCKVGDEFGHWCDLVEGFGEGGRLADDIVNIGKHLLR